MADSLVPHQKGVVVLGLRAKDQNEDGLKLACRNLQRCQGFSKHVTEVAGRTARVTRTGHEARRTAVSSMHCIDVRMWTDPHPNVKMLG